MKKILSALVLLASVSFCFAAVEPTEGAKQTITLKSGWNLVTLNRKVDLTGENPQIFLKLNPVRFDSSNGSYIDCKKSEDLIPGASYWIYNEKAETVTVEPDLALVAGNKEAAEATAGKYSFVGMAAGSKWADDAECIMKWDGNTFVATDAAEVKAAAKDNKGNQVGSGIGYWVKMK